MPTLRLQLGLLLLQLALHTQGQLSDLRRCADPMCQKVIAEAHTTVKYPSAFKGVLSFPNNAVVKIYSKEAGSNPELWGVEINGEYGYAPKKFLREDKILVPDKLLQHIVPVDLSSQPFTNDKNELPIDAKIVNKIEGTQTPENFTDDSEEDDGLEEFFDDDEDEEDLDGIQLYNTDINPDSTTETQPTAETLSTQKLEAEEKSENEISATEHTSEGSAREASAELSPSNVDFSVIDGTTIFNDPVEATQPTPTYLPDYETPPPPPAYATTTDTADTTTPTPALASSAQTMAPLSVVGVDSSTTPELQIVPSGLPHSSLASREASVSATHVPVYTEGAASSTVITDTSVVDSSVKSSSDDQETKEEALPTDGNDKANGAEGSVLNEEGADASKENADEINNQSLNDSNLELSSEALTSKGNDADIPSSLEDSSVGIDKPVEQNFVPFSPITKLDSSSDVTLNTDDVIEEVLHDDLTGDVPQTVDKNSNDRANTVLQSDNPSSNVEETAQDSSDDSFDSQAEGGLFDGWLSGWSSAEDSDGADVGASEGIPSVESSPQNEPDTLSELSDVANSGDGGVENAPSSVDEGSSSVTDDQATNRGHSSSFDATTEDVVTKTTEATFVTDIPVTHDSSEMLQQNTVSPAGRRKSSANSENTNAQREQRKKKIRKNFVQALKTSASRTLSATRKHTKEFLEKTATLEPTSVRKHIASSATTQIALDNTAHITSAWTGELQSSMSSVPLQSSHLDVKPSSFASSENSQSMRLDTSERQKKHLRSSALSMELSHTSTSKFPSTSKLITQNISAKQSETMAVNQVSSTVTLLKSAYDSVHKTMVSSITQSLSSTMGRESSLSSNSMSGVKEFGKKSKTPKSQYYSSLLDPVISKASKSDLPIKTELDREPPKGLDDIRKNRNISDTPNHGTTNKKSKKPRSLHSNTSIPSASFQSAKLKQGSESVESGQSAEMSAGDHNDDGAVSDSETVSDSATAVDAQSLADGGPLEGVTSTSPIPDLKELDFESGKEEVDARSDNSDSENSALNSEPSSKTPESISEAPESIIETPDHFTEASEPLIEASVLGLSEAEPSADVFNSVDQQLVEEMFGSSAAEQPADASGAVPDSSGETVANDGNTGTPTESDAAGDPSDLHHPESLTGHLLKTVEPIVQLMTGSSELGESLSLALEHDLSTPVAASGTLAVVVIVALTILLLYVTSALINKCSREGPLLKALNVLEHEQHTAEQLIADLQRKLSSGHGQIENAVGVVDSAEVSQLTSQLQQVQEENVALAERVQDLEQQLEESTSSGLEMDNMLQELLHSQKDTANFQEAIDSLQLMLDSQREKVESLTADLSIKTTLNEELRGESASAKERIKKLEYQLDQVTKSLEEVNSAKAQVVAQLVAEQAQVRQLTEERDTLARSSSDSSAALAALTEQHDALKNDAQKLRSTLKTKEAELQVTKECLKQLKVFNDGKAAKEKLSQLLDSVKARSELASAQEERRALEAELQQRGEQMAQLERRVQEVQEEAEQCRNEKTSADQEKQEALSKLAVLTDYFHEKEAQLTKELESESGLRLDAEGSAESITSRIRDYDMQLLAYKTQVNTLKKELEDQEVSFKTQLAAQEQKAHESWVAARAAERKYEESKQETAQMRSRLLLMSKDNSDQQHAIIKPTPQHAETSNGSVSSPRPPLHDDLDGEHSHPLDSPPPIPPPHMLPHLFPPPPNLPPGIPPPFPPPHFLPPPLPPPMMADRRLPPAGRLASPPFHRRMGAASPPEFLDRRSPPHFDRRSYSPASERSRYSDRQGRYSPDRHGRYSPDRHGRYSPDRQGRYSPDRQGRFSPDRLRRYSPDRMYDRHHHSDRYNSTDRHSDAYSSNGRNDSQRDSSPERPYNRSPEGFARKASPPPLHRRLYEEGSGPPPRKGKKTSTPLGPNDR